MNQRIKELAEQAQIWIADYHGQRWEIDPKKFAELIVQECIYLCQTTAPGRDAEDIEDAIRKYFGVEE